MISLRKSNARGHFNHGWLDTFHTFSFADYYDPKFTHFRALRVINEDRIAGGGGFGTHPHENMEILTYVLEGSLEHRDSMGTGSVIRAGELQKMSAGTGITHSEANASRTDSVHLYQVWIFPKEKGLRPEYQQKSFAANSSATGKLLKVASQDGAEGSIIVHQDMNLYLCRPNGQMEYRNPASRHAWVQITRGRLQMGDQDLEAGDGLAIAGGERLLLQGAADSEFMLFDLA